MIPDEWLSFYLRWTLFLGALGFAGTSTLVAATSWPWFIDVCVFFTVGAVYSMIAELAAVIMNGKHTSIKGRHSDRQLR